MGILPPSPSPHPLLGPSGHAHQARLKKKSGWEKKPADSTTFSSKFWTAPRREDSTYKPRHSKEAVWVAGAHFPGRRVQERSLPAGKEE